VVFAIADPNPRVNGGGAKLLQDAGLKVESGLLAAEAEALNAGFLLRMREGRPFVRLKTGASLDGRTALANGQSQWITSEESRADVQLWRARSSAVLTTASTVLADDPRLDVRIETERQPMRVVLDRRRRVRKSARILRPPGEVLMFAGPSRARTLKNPELLGDARVERLPTRDFLKRVFARLGELQINEVLVEAGPRFAGILLAGGFVDEWLLYLAPKLLGKDAKPLAALPRLTRLDAAPAFTMLESRAVGPDLRLRLRPEKR
jgi:diaminohydroxyphosphoribosylaminopyrimidine deaminase / 5-amino-6-(5-phosphoribosylamino)uracil reductase